MVFQDATDSLNPRFTAFRAIADPLPPTADRAVSGRAIPWSDPAQQRHKIIGNRLASVGEESVSGVTGGGAAGLIRSTHHAHLHYRE